MFNAVYKILKYLGTKIEQYEKILHNNELLPHSQHRSNNAHLTHKLTLLENEKKKTENKWLAKYNGAYDNI